MDDSKRANVSSSEPFPQVVVFSFLFCQVIPAQTGKVDHLYVTSAILAFYGCINYTIHSLKIWEDSPGSIFSDNYKIYIETGVVVVVSYVLLLGVNWSYIWLVVFPVISIGFIFALCKELNRLSGSQQHDDGESSSGGEEGGRETKKAEWQEAAALVLYWVLCIMGQFHISDRLAISQFLLFFSFMLGALTRMMTRLALTGAAPGVAPASVLLRKASLIVLLATVHAFAAELLGENVVLFILPELAPVLIWLSLHIDRHDGTLITADKITSHRNAITVLGAASAVVFAFLAGFKDEFVLAWCTKAMVSCGVSALLLYYIVFMLCQWPGLEEDAAAYFVEEAVKLLRLWANTLLWVFAAVAVVCFSLLRQTDAEPSRFFSDYM